MKLINTNSISLTKNYACYVISCRLIISDKNNKSYNNLVKSLVSHTHPLTVIASGT